MGRARLTERRGGRSAKRIEITQCHAEVRDVLARLPRWDGAHATPALLGGLEGELAEAAQTENRGQQGTLVEDDRLGEVAVAGI